MLSAIPADAFPFQETLKLSSVAKVSVYGSVREVRPRLHQNTKPESAPKREKLADARQR